MAKLYTSNDFVVLLPKKRKRNCHDELVEINNRSKVFVELSSSPNSKRNISFVGNKPSPNSKSISPNKSFKPWIEIPSKHVAIAACSLTTSSSPGSSRGSASYYDYFRYRLDSTGSFQTTCRPTPKSPPLKLFDSSDDVSHSRRLPSIGKKKRSPRCRSYSLDSLPEGLKHLRVSNNTFLDASTLDQDDNTSTTPKRCRYRSLSVGSVPDTDGGENTEYDNINQMKAVYQPPIEEVKETRHLYVPGESQGKGKPVRFLDSFAFYDENDNYVDFMEIDTLLANSVRSIRGSGKVTRCLVHEEDSDSDVDEPPPTVSFQIPNAIWTDYEATEIDDIWNIKSIGVETPHAWYILKRPAESYLDFFYRFWLSHYTTWKALTMVRVHPTLIFDEFCSMLVQSYNVEARNCLGRPLEKEDFEQNFVGIYVYEQLSLFVEGRKFLVKSPLIQHLIIPACEAGYSLPLSKAAQYGRHKKTITMPLVHELTEGLFLRTLLKAGMSLSAKDQANKLIQQPRVPDIMHPDPPTNIDWGQPVEGVPNFFQSITLDGETYSVGDVIMVNPGEDDMEHRARSALEQRSQARDNELSNKVWFCQIMYMFNKDISDRKPVNNPTAHVRWYEHGSKTLLQETAHPYGLFAIAECNDIPLESILGRCDIIRLKPGDEEPNDYHCAFVWDAEEVQFLDISVFEKDTINAFTNCPSCNYNKRKRLESSEIQVHSDVHASVRGIDYHKNDLVYIATEPRRPYQIGLVHRFVSSARQVKVRLFGRYDDVVDYSDSSRDERRLFRTSEFQTVDLEFVEGKCFLRDKFYVLDRRYKDHFYADLESDRLNVRSTAGLHNVDSEPGDTCRICRSAFKNEQRDLLRYLKANPPLKVMELFAGAGGLSTGLEQSGAVKTIWAIELCPRAAATFQANHAEAIVFNADTNECLQHAIDFSKGKKPKKLKTVNPGDYFMPQKGEVDLIAGGFPCQSFSGMNHLRHKSADDSRTPLVANMLSYVEYYRPRFVLMENVKGLFEHHSKVSGEDEEENEIKMSVVKFILRTLLCLGYQAEIKLLQAADYGSPQRRERVIIWGALRSETLPQYPLPTHVDPMRRPLRLNLPTYDILMPVQRSEHGCAPYRALVIADAISDLPTFDWKKPGVKAQATPLGHPSLSAVSEVNRRTLVGFIQQVPYASKPRSRYQSMLRGGNVDVTLHCSRSFSEQIVERVWYATSPGVRSIHDIPTRLWTSSMMKKVRMKDKSKLKKMWALRFGRSGWTEPFTTALTSCRPFAKGGKILHPTQRRILTARECARSQGFPDSYEFKMLQDDNTLRKWAELMDSIHKQIGNAVPVPLADALGTSLRETLLEKWLRQNCERQTNMN